MPREHACLWRLSTAEGSEWERSHAARRGTRGSAAGPAAGQRCGAGRAGTVRAVRCGAGRCGEVRHGEVRRGAVRCGAER